MSKIYRHFLEKLTIVVGRLASKWLCKQQSNWFFSRMLDPHPRMIFPAQCTRLAFFPIFATIISALILSMLLLMNCFDFDQYQIQDQKNLCTSWLKQRYFQGHKTTIFKYLDAFFSDWQIWKKIWMSKLRQLTKVILIRAENSYSINLWPLWLLYFNLKFNLMLSNRKKALKNQTPFVTRSYFSWIL